ncbi:MAG: hemin uptake protein HemP [Curvibacter sp.]
MDTGSEHARTRQEQQPPAAAAPPRPDAPVLDSEMLLQGGRAVTIRHRGEVYRLQATRQGKLILTK